MMTVLLNAGGHTKIERIQFPVPQRKARKPEESNPQNAPPKNLHRRSPVRCCVRRGSIFFRSISSPIMNRRNSNPRLAMPAHRFHGP